MVRPLWISHTPTFPTEAAVSLRERRLDTVTPFSLVLAF